MCNYLVNDYPCDIYYQGIIYPSISHAFQAARSEFHHIRKKIQLADSLEELYELASKIENPENWKQDRLTVMESIIRDKFFRHKDLKAKLKATQ